MIIVVSNDRKILAITTDEFTIRLNGRSNADYKSILKPLGIELQFEKEKPSAEAKATLGDSVSRPSEASGESGPAESSDES